MSSGIEVGTAFVRILPDMTAFNAALETQVNASTAGAANTKVAASATAAAASTKALAGAQTVSSASAARVAAAELAVTRATIAATAATEALNVAIAKNVSATKIQELTQKSAVAAQALNVAQLRQQSVLQGVPVRGGKGILDVGTGTNAARGALIGLARVTPVAVFGLGVIGTAAIGAGLALKSAIGSAAEFQSQLNTFQAVTQSTDEQMQQVSSTALALGADLSLPATSANDAAVALTELSKAGLSVEDSLAAAKGVLQLATIAGISAGDAAVIAATQLNAFGLAGGQAARVTELLADASIAAQGEITDFAAGFAQAGTAAKQSGVSIEDTTALLTQLGLAGLKGADGGTSLRTFLLRLVPTTKEAAQYTKALGIELDKNRSIGSQLPDVIEQYRKQLQLLNPQQQTLVLNQIFGQDAFRAASVIFSQNKDALLALRKEFERTNSTQDLSRAKAEGLSGAFGSLKSQLQTAGTQLGLVADGPLEAFVRGLSNTFDNIGKVAGALGDLAASHDIVKKVSVVFDVQVPSALVPGSGKGESLGSFLKDAAALAGHGSALVILNNMIDRLIPDEEKVPLNLPTSSRGGPVPESVKKEAERVARLQTPAAKARQKAVDKIVADQAAADQALKGIPVPKGLQQAQVDAQINNSLSAELSADNAILKYLEAKRARLDEGTKAFLAASKQVEAAQSQRDSVQAEIDGNSERQKADRDAARKKRVSDAQEEARKDQAAQEQLRRTIVSIQSQRFSNALAAANLTETDADNKKVLSAEQRRLEAARKAAEKIARTAGLTKQQLAEAKLKVLELDGQILGIKSQIKNLGSGGSSGGGFSLNDLFKEALNQFQEFGSNVSSSPLTPGGVRGAFAGNLITAITGSKESRKELGLDRVAVSTSSMDLTLKNIERLLRGEPAPKGSTVGDKHVGRLATANAAGLASRRIGGV